MHISRNQSRVHSWWWWHRKNIREEKQTLSPPSSVDFIGPADFFFLFCFFHFFECLQLIIINYNWLMVSVAVLSLCTSDHLLHPSLSWGWFSAQSWTKSLLWLKWCNNNMKMIFWSWYLYIPVFLTPSPVCLPTHWKLDTFYAWFLVLYSLFFLSPLSKYWVKFNSIRQTQVAPTDTLPCN